MRNHSLAFFDRLLASGGVVGLVLASLATAPVYAQEEVIEEIVVTGSAVRRTDLDTALPIQLLTAEDITQTGVTNAMELMDTLPAMQNYITASDSVGGSGGGIRTANLRGIGDQYTLSLLNGRRMAPADSGSSIDLSNIPLAAVERVEVLADGASALYGSDAIAGVVNFILKDEVDQTTFSLRGDVPQEDGGDSWIFDIVTGFGDLDQDGWSFVASYSHEEQDQLAAADRDFAETGFVFFNYAGERMYFQNSSANSIPGNAYVYTQDYDALITSFNPYAQANGGVCATQTTPTDLTCQFDYTSTIEIQPEFDRDSVFLNGKLQFTENLTGFATVLWSQYAMTTRIAPYPTGEIPLPLDSALVQNEVLPYLSPAELAALDIGGPNEGEVTGTWRALPAGNRTTEWDTESTNITAGLEGNFGTFNYTAAVTHAITNTEQNYPTGWLLLDEFVAAGSSGAFNIFAGQDTWTDADQQALNPTIYSGPWDEVDNTMTALEVQGSMPVFELSGGEAQLAVGADYRITNYDRSISQANEDELLLFLSKDTPYELERDQWGIYGELWMPLMDNLEVTASVRYDDISAVEDKLNGGSIDKGDDDVTYKFSALYRLTDMVAFRGSYGTGFKAPSMREIGEPLSEFGVTSGTYDCPFTAGDPLFQYCRPQAAQYDVYRQGAASLQFETSTQWTVGAVLEPWEGFDMTVDYWNIELEDLVQRLTESQIFNNADLYPNLFTTKTNLATNQEFLAIIQEAVNAGTRDNSGIDYALNQVLDTGWGTVELGVRGTYMLESDSSLTGSSLGKFGNDDAVVFRNRIAFKAGLYSGNWSHNVNIWFRSGYDDQAQEVEITGTGAPLGEGPTQLVQLKVDSYTTMDYLVEYRMLEDSLGITFGVTNLTDEAPPLSLRTSGSGHQVGWDPRYSDAYGRTFFLKAEYSLF
ncbi:MAG: TonB-dependent receptor plug domain-containing protein [Pseudomonadales bacterium]